jgi:hypothetical protein
LAGRVVGNSRIPYPEAMIFVGRYFGAENHNQSGCLYSLEYIRDACRKWIQDQRSNSQPMFCVAVHEAVLAGLEEPSEKERVAAVSVMSPVFAGDALVTDLKVFESILNDLAGHLAKVCLLPHTQVFFRGETWRVAYQADPTGSRAPR